MASGQPGRRGPRPTPGNCSTPDSPPTLPSGAPRAPVEVTEWTVPWPDSRPRDPYVDAQGRVAREAGTYARAAMERRFRQTLRRAPEWLQRLVMTGVLPSDSDELRVRKAVLVLSTTLMGSLASVWVVTYASLGLWLSAAIPFVYQLASLASVSAWLTTCAAAPSTGTWPEIPS